MSTPAGEWPLASASPANSPAKSLYYVVPLAGLAGAVIGVYYSFQSGRNVVENWMGPSGSRFPLRAVDKKHTKEEITSPYRLATVNGATGWVTALTFGGVASVVQHKALSRMLGPSTIHVSSFTDVAKAAGPNSVVRALSLMAVCFSSGMVKAVTDATTPKQ